MESPACTNGRVPAELGVATAAATLLEIPATAIAAIPKAAVKTQQRSQFIIEAVLALQIAAVGIVFRFKRPEAELGFGNTVFGGNAVTLAVELQ